MDQLGELLTNSVGKFSRDQSLVILKELSRYVMHEIIENYDINPKTVSSAGVVVNGCINNLSKDPKSVAKMLQLMSNLPYILKHSTTVSIFAIILAQGLGIHDKKRLNAIGMGAFLHDIGVGQLTFDPEDEEHLTASQRKEMWRHPELGVQQLDGIQGIDRDILEIIRQHHEQPNGCGYPNGLKSDEISPLAKIVSIADTFSSLITKRIFRRALTLSEALEILKADKGKFDGSFIEAFATVLRKPFS